MNLQDLYLIFNFCVTFLISQTVLIRMIFSFRIIVIVVLFILNSGVDLNVGFYSPVVSPLQRSLLCSNLCIFALEKFFLSLFLFYMS